MYNNLKKERLLKDLSQKKLAELIGVSRVTISNIERGVFNPSGEIMLSIAQIFNKPVEEIFFKDSVKRVLQFETIA